MATWEASWEFELPAESAEDLLVALVVRDLLHGSSYDVELEEGEEQVAVDFQAFEELGGEVFRLLIDAEVDGPEDHAMLQELAEKVLEELIEEAERLVEQRTEIGELPSGQVAARSVPEDDEKWDLVIPEWMAPEGAEVPFGFRSYRADSGELWPTDADLDAHGRVVVVPFGDVVRLYGIPAPSNDWAPTDAEGEDASPEG